MQLNLVSIYNHYQQNNLKLGQSMEKLSSGQRINKAGDDAAGLAISEKMRSQIRGMNQVNRNIEDGKSMLQVADKTLEISQDMLHRLNELAVQGSTDTLSDSDRVEMGKEVNQLLEQMDVMFQSTKFNGKKLFDGNGDFMITVGANGEGSYVNINYMAMDGLTGFNKAGTTALSLEDFKLGESQEIGSRETMENLSSVVQSALKKVSGERGYIGARYNRFEFAQKSLDLQSENLQSAESRIRDVDVAKEMMQMTKHKLLADVSMAMLAQGMQNNQQVLTLLRG